ncbi:hypothetical protein BDZ91DRAFT_239203 [Kalaharituber pfeilii]|nr:hypothetical protein BDZ91DRAFT_380207 [Kalaharituber pfeilii]KAF8465042.1 hypothetical protein BDZ91DRAFT_239203 [Kalaharituber pfeilii]
MDLCLASGLLFGLSWTTRLPPVCGGKTICVVFPYTITPRNNVVNFHQSRARNSNAVILRLPEYYQSWPHACSCGRIVCRHSRGSCSRVTARRRCDCGDLLQHWAQAGSILIR